MRPLAIAIRRPVSLAAVLAASSLLFLDLTPALAHKAKAAADSSKSAVANSKPGTVKGTVSVTEKDGTRATDGAIVYIEKVDASAEAVAAGDRAPELRRMEMKLKRFWPRVLPVLVGEEISFPNQDSIFHNVFSLTGKNKFDLGLYKDGASKTKTFTEPGVVRVFCNIHPGMVAFVLVLQNPYFDTTSAADGAFTLSGVPPGSYTLHAWHERGGETTRSLDLAPGETATAVLELDASGFKQLPHKNKFGQDYNDGY